MTKLGRILMVEDDPKDVELTLTALEEYKLANEVVGRPRRPGGLDYSIARGIQRPAPSENPAVMLLDLKLPKVDGLEVLKQVKADERLKLIPVVVLTSSREERTWCELPARRKRLCGEAGRFPRVRQCDQGARHLLGGHQ